MQPPDTLDSDVPHNVVPEVVIKGFQFDNVQSCCMASLFIVLTKSAQATAALGKCQIHNGKHNFMGSLIRQSCSE